MSNYLTPYSVFTLCIEWFALFLIFYLIEGNHLMLYHFCSSEREKLDVVVYPVQPCMHCTGYQKQMNKANITLYKQYLPCLVIYEVLERKTKNYIQNSWWKAYLHVKDCKRLISSTYFENKYSCKSAIFHSITFQPPQSRFNLLKRKVINKK